MKFKYYELRDKFLSAMYSNEEIIINKYNRRPFAGIEFGTYILVFPETTIKVHNLHKHSNKNYYEYIYECESTQHGEKRRLNLTNVLMVPNQLIYIKEFKKMNEKFPNKLDELERKWNHKDDINIPTLQQKIAKILKMHHYSNFFRNKHKDYMKSRIYTLSKIN